MNSSSKYENDNALQYFFYIGQFDGENLESDLSSKCEDKEIINQCSTCEN